MFAVVTIFACLALGWSLGFEIVAIAGVFFLSWGAATVMGWGLSVPELLGAMVAVVGFVSVRLVAA